MAGAQQQPCAAPLLHLLPIFPTKQHPQRVTVTHDRAPFLHGHPAPCLGCPEISSSELLPCVAVVRPCYYLAPSSRSELHRRPAQQAARCSSLGVQLRCAAVPIQNSGPGFPPHRVLRSICAVPMVLARCSTKCAVAPMASRVAGLLFCVAQ
jgi:hypothetical protein